MDELQLNNIDVADLIRELQQEKLLVNAERSCLHELNEKLHNDTELLLKIAWINLQQRVNLNALIFIDSTPEQCTNRANYLINSHFIDAKDALEYQAMINYSDFLSNLRQRPDMLAQWIVIGESLIQDQKMFSSVLHSIVAGLYGALILQQDIGLMLNLLQNLAKLQLVTTDNPRRLLKQSSCAFSKMYFLFHENLISAKHFLIAALQTPILKLIAASHTYFDINPTKALSRMSQLERQAKFGEEGGATYAIKTAQYRKWMNGKIYELTQLFIESLQEHIFCFPSSLAWLIRHIAHMISKSFNPHSKEINAISTDLVFTLFICPAIVQPEPYGICDAPITDMARHNLMQIGQILQMLALLKFETPDAKTIDLYELFASDGVANILDVILNDADTFCESNVPIENVPGIYRSVSLFTEQELFNLVSFLRRAYDSIVQDQNSQETASNDYCSNNADNATTLPNDPIVIILKKLPTENNESPRSTLNNNITAIKKPKSKAKSHLLKQQIANGECADDSIFPTVLIIPLHNESEEIGLLPEEKILETSLPTNIVDEEEEEEEDLIDISDHNNPSEIVATAIQEKRTRFTIVPIASSSNSVNNIVNDEGSIGNTSDNLEVISEAASNHSVASSIELENEEDQNDNLSDMVSANVSGRGTPNISGRDTPSSQVTENEDNNRVIMVEARQPFIQQQPLSISKQIRSEIDDKFCKFEIKKLLEGDETISIISDTWSTDVLASDSETIDANDRIMQFPTMQNAGAHHAQNVVVMEANANLLLDVSETHSESAWSTDVLASDTERLTEFDTDDVASVAPSDDTASVARSDDAASVAPSERSEIDDGCNNDRRLSTTSNSNFMNFSQNNSPSAFQEYRRIDTSIRRESMPNYLPAARNDPPNIADLTNTYERFNISDTPLAPLATASNILRPISRTCLDPSKREAILIDKATTIEVKRSILGDISNIEANEKTEPTTSSYILVKNIEQHQQNHKYPDDMKIDMQLSNTSLNSSTSSGGGSTGGAVSSSSSCGENANKNEQQETSEASTSSTWRKKATWLDEQPPTILLIDGGGGVRMKKSASNDGNIKPSPSTGAIPKSISFDMSAEKGDKDMYDEQKSGGGSKRSISSNFFTKLRINFRQRRGNKSYRGGAGAGNCTTNATVSDEFSGTVRFDGLDEDVGLRRHSDGKSNSDASEDILAKYRNKPNENGSNSSSNNNNTIKMEKSRDCDDESHLPINQNTKLDAISIFNHAKRKLRLVLSNAKTQTFKTKKDELVDEVGGTCGQKDLESLLQLELAKARDLRQWRNAARIGEALRCIRTLDMISFHKICDSLRNDYCNRSVYLKYLLRSKQTLLASQEYLNELIEQVNREKELCSTFLANACVKAFLERYLDDLQRFCDEFRKLTLVDEKNDHLAMFLNELYDKMHKDALWHDSSNEQFVLAQLAVERSVMIEVYPHALYPNGESDRLRDSLLNDHLRKLSRTITLNNKYLMINKIYQHESPWLPAQEALQAMAAYKTPREKLQCVRQCAISIDDLLTLAQRGSATADDVMPVLIYVIIQANPQDLLSTIQYVNSFYNLNTGEDNYLWTQFCSAVEFTKTMEYAD